MALVENVKYGLSSHNNQTRNKTAIFVKLTDSALRAVEDYLKAQQTTGHCATLRFLGNEGNIRIPSATNENGHGFDFSLSTNSDIEGPKGSFECIQLCGAKSLESAGPLSYKMRIKANDDVFVQTQQRFTELENESKQLCAKEIKSNCADIGRKVKNRVGMPSLPPRREKSPSYISHQSKHSPVPSFANSSNSQKLPNGYNNAPANRKVLNGTSTPNNGNNGLIPPANINNNGTAPKNGVGSGAQDVSRRPLKERLIHMLAVKPYKKPELFQRLCSDGLKDRDKKVFMTILQQITNFKDNVYSLLRGVWNDVQEDWPFYTESEKQQMKRRKPQNLTPPGSDCSVGSGTSSLSPRSNSSIGSGHSPSYSQSNYSKSSVAMNGSGDSYKGPPSSDGTELSKGTKRPVNGILPEGVEDYGDIPHKKTRVSHFKRPGSGGGSSSGNGANPNVNYRSELLVKQDKDASSGSSPQFSTHSNRIAERLSPIGTSASNFSGSGGGGAGGHINNHRSPRGTFEPMDVSPNGYHGSGGEAMDESISGSSWVSRNGHDSHGLSDSEKISRGDSDETDSVDSGNGSSASGSSHGSQQSYVGGHAVGYSNGSIKPEKSEVVPHGGNSSNNGCNRVSSTTNFQTTPQSSPDSQLDMMQLQQKCQSGNSNGFSGKYNQRVNGKCNVEPANVEIIITRDKGCDREYWDSHRSKKNDNHRGKEKEREMRNKERSKKSGNERKMQRKSDEREGSNDVIFDDDSSVKLEYPSYLTKYTAITSSEVRSKYKEDFNAEYLEYRDLHAVIDKVSKRFAHLEERLRKEERGTDGYEKIKEQIVNEYYANKRDKKYQETRQKFQYLHEKLSHIKRLVADYDAHHQESDMSSDYCNGFRN